MPEHTPPTPEEVASIRGVLVETALSTAARPHEEKAPSDFDRLVAEVERLRATRCENPGAASCAKQWEADHQWTAIEIHGLADEFEADYGCDAIDAVCEALVNARRENERLRAVVRRVVSFTATCRPHNTDEWMDLLVDTLNETLEAVGEPSRVVRDKDMLRFTRPEAS